MPKTIVNRTFRLGCSQPSYQMHGILEDALNNGQKPLFEVGIDNRSLAKLGLTVTGAIVTGEIIKSLFHNNKKRHG